MISKNFFQSLNDIALERQIDINELIKKVEFAIGIACRKEGYNGDIKIEADFEKNRLKVYEYKYVVEEIDPEINQRGQILVEAAQEIKPKSKAGDVFKAEINVTTFKRTSASIFRQTLINGIKELERDAAYIFFNDKIGEVITAKVVKYDQGFVTFNVGNGCEAYMPDKEALKGEEFIPGENKKVYVVNVERGTKGPKIYLSRTNKELVKKLFELEVPEIANGTIEIMGISRDPGSRSKVGVLSLNPNLDAKATCIGSGGLRIRAINEALNNEKIDIFTWRDDPINLIAEAMAPAQVLSVIADEKTKQAVVVVADDQFSLAIGKGGQNAKLAAYAINWKIDIKKLNDAVAEGLECKYNVTIQTGSKKRK